MVRKPFFLSDNQSAWGNLMGSKVHYPWYLMKMRFIFTIFFPFANPPIIRGIYWEYVCRLFLYHFLHIYYNIICIRIILLYNILFISYIYIFILYHIIISMYWYFYYYHYNCYLDYSSSTICHGSLDCRLPILGTWRKDCKQMILAMLPPLGPATCV